MKNIFRRTLVAAVAVMMLFAFAACGVKMDISFDISSDGTVKTGVITAYDEEMIDMMLDYGETSESEDDEAAADPDEDDTAEDGGVKHKTYTDEERWEYIEKNVLEGISDKTYEKYEFTDDKNTHWMGFKVLYKDVKIDDITADSKPDERVNVYNYSEDILEGKLFYKSGQNYVSNMTIDTAGNDDFASMKENQQYMDINMMVVVTLPSKPVSNNATSVSEDGKTLTWDLMQIEESDIDFEFSLNSFPIGLVLSVVLGIVAAACIAVVVVVILNLAKKGKEDDARLAALAGDVPKKADSPVQSVIHDAVAGREEPVADAASAVTEPLEEAAEVVSDAAEPVEESVQEVTGSVQAAEDAIEDKAQEAEEVIQDTEESVEEAAAEAEEEPADPSEDAPTE